MPPRWVADSSVWIDLANGGVLDAAFGLSVVWCVPDLLLDELRTSPTGEDLVARGVQVVELSGSQVAELATRTQEDSRLSFVDVAAFVVARDAAGLLLTGDARLRTLSVAQGKEVHGVLWLLDQLLAAELLLTAAAAEALARMVEKGARLPADEVQGRLARWRG